MDLAGILLGILGIAGTILVACLVGLVIYGFYKLLKEL